MASLSHRPHLPHRRMGPPPLEGPAMTIQTHTEAQRHGEARTNVRRSFLCASAPLCEIFVWFVLIAGASHCKLAASAADRPTVLVLVGAEGAKEYTEPFRDWAARWEK